MYANRNSTVVRMLISLVMLSLIASACSSSTTVTTPVVANPTKASSKPLSTPGPAETVQPGTNTGKTASKAASKAASKPAAQALPAAKPAVKPTTAPAAAPTKSAPVVKVMPTAMPPSEPAIAPTNSAPVAPTTAAMNGIHIGTAQTANELSILPSKYEIVDKLGTDMPKAGEQFLVVTVTIENTSKTASLPFDSADLLALDTSGKSLPMVILKSATTELTTETLSPGAKLEGVIVYQVPKTDKTADLEFKAANSPTLTWVIG